MKETASSSAAKVWLGSLPPSVTEQFLKSIMDAYGVVTQIYYSQKAGARGWAFITYATKEQAANAIQNIGGKLSFHDSDRPVEVRFAQDNKHSNNNENVNNSNETDTSSLLSSPQINQNTNNNNASMNSNMSHTLNNVNNTSLSLMTGGGGGVNDDKEIPQMNSSSSTNPPASSTTATPTYLWQQYYRPDGHTYFYNTMTGHTQWEKPVITKEIQVILQNNINNLPAAQKAALTQNLMHSARIHSQNNQNSKSNAGKTTGPPGSNLFIFHVPGEWEDVQLKSHFAFFGNIISCKVAQNESGRNSGFGFVSFDNQASASAAVCYMNGCNVGQKYLKVQLKKGEEQYALFDATSDNAK